MMTEAYLENKDLSAYYGKNFSAHSGDISHMPVNFGLIDLVSVPGLTADKLNASIRDYLDEAIPHPGAWPNFNVGNHDKSRVASRVGEELVDAVNMVYMLLPGSPITYYGEEIGMQDLQESLVSPIQSQHLIVLNYLKLFYVLKFNKFQFLNYKLNFYIN